MAGPILRVKAFCAERCEWVSASPLLARIHRVIWKLNGQYFCDIKHYGGSMRHRWKEGGDSALCGRLKSFFSFPTSVLLLLLSVGAFLILAHSRTFNGRSSRQRSWIIKSVTREKWRVQQLHYFSITQLTVKVLIWKFNFETSLLIGISEEVDLVAVLVRRLCGGGCWRRSRRCGAWAWEKNIITIVRRLSVNL